MGSVYKQPEKEEDDSCHSWRVPSKWKRGTRGSKRETARGARGSWEKGKRNNAMYICNYNVCAKNN
jgi:hypothetical protein